MRDRIEPCFKCGSRERLLRVAASALTRLHDAGTRLVVGMPHEEPVMYYMCCARCGAQDGSDTQTEGWLSLGALLDAESAQTASRDPEGRDLPRETARAVVYMPLTAILPEPMPDDFLGRLSDRAPFSWGDNNLSIVTLDRLLDHAEHACGDDPAMARWIASMRPHGSLYVDLES